MHLILDLSLGERRAIVDAPIDRLQSLIDKILLEEVIKCLDNLRFVLVRHGEVRVIPASEHSNALELGPLQINILLRVLAAGAAHRDRIHFQLLAAKLLIYFDLDRQAVAVPAWYIGRVKAGHGL